MDTDQSRPIGHSEADMTEFAAGRLVRTPRGVAASDEDTTDLDATAPSGEGTATDEPQPPRLRRPSQARARSRSATSLYDRMGGAVALRRLVRRFNDAMATLPEAAEARAVLHVAPSDLGPKLYEFLSGWLGGPDLYTKRHGAPKLKRRHFLVPIGPAQRDGWLACFRLAAVETISDPAVVAEIMPQIESLAHYLTSRS